MKLLKNNLIFLLPVLSGILLILAYPPSNLGILVLIALIPLFYFLSLGSINHKKAFLGGTLTGIIFFGKLFSWLFATYPFEWLGITTSKNTVLIFILLVVLYIVQSIFLGLFFGIFAWILKLSSKKWSELSFGQFIVIPALWIILEYLRAWGFGIFWLGKETLFGPHWTFGNLAYTLHNNTTLIQIADIGGIYGISFLIVLVSVVLFAILKQCWKSDFQHIAVLLIILGLVGTAWVGYGIYKIKFINSLDAGEKTKVALLQTNFLSGAEFNSYQKKDVFDAILGLFKTQEKADIIIAPEGFGIVGLTQDTKIAKYLLKDFYKPGQVYLENRKIVDEHGKTKSRLFFYELESEYPVGYHDKMLLVPGGDYLPYLIKFALNLYSFNLDYAQRFYQKGEKIEPGLTSKGNIGGTICSGILSPDINRKLTKSGAEFLVSVSSDAPFRGANSLLIQNLAMSKLRAVENRRYFAQATNMGYSFLLNPKGEIILKSSQLGNEILLGSISLLNKKTLYTKFGDWIILLAILILVGAKLRPIRSYPQL